MELFQSSSGKSDGRYELGLPWKKDSVKLPNNLSLAKQRLQSLERSLSKHPEKEKKYKNAKREYEINGWAGRLTESEIRNSNGAVYYLPRYGIYGPEEEYDTTNCSVPACPYQGMSLNYFVYKGPCLIRNFRIEAVAFAGDIS